MEHINYFVPTKEMLGFLRELSELMEKHGVEIDPCEETTRWGYGETTSANGIEFEQQEPYCSCTISGRPITAKGISEFVDKTGE